jgi:spore germination protein GerM
MSTTTRPRTPRVPRWFRSSSLLLATLLLVALTAACAAGQTAQVETASMRVLVYFSNDRLATDPTDCAAVFPVERSVPRTTAVATAALRELFRGPTPAEQALGFRSFFSAATAGLLRDIRIDGGTAYVNLHDLRAELSGATSSCGAAEFQSQVSRTMLQFPTVKRIIYAIDGEPRTFYEWMNESCRSANDNCDPRPFKGGG